MVWLARDRMAAESGITRANARSLIDEWITHQGSWHPVGWQPEILARRVICWLCHSPFILQDADAKFYKKFIRSLSRQVRYLRRTVKDTRSGLPRLRALGIDIETGSFRRINLERAPFGLPAPVESLPDTSAPTARLEVYDLHAWNG